MIGGDDFRDTLEKIVELQSKVLKLTRSIGKALKVSTQITFGGTGGLIEFLEDADIIDKFILRTKEAKDKLQEINNGILENNEKLLKGLNGQLDRFELERLIFEIETQIRLDTKQFDVDKNLLIKVKKELDKTLEDLPPIKPKIKISLDKAEIQVGDQNKLIQDLIKDQIERLKIDGAIESQQLKIKDALLREFDVTDNILKQKQRQLDIERSITEEQKARVSFSSESAKLAEIAKNEGVQTAIAIGEVLSGQRDFNTFLRQGGERAEILKSTFEKFVENKQLEQFFKGQRVIGQPGLRGGQRIPIRELGGAARGVTPARATIDFQLAKARLGLKESTDKQITATNVSTQTMKDLIDIMSQGGVATGKAVLQAQAVSNEINRLANIQRIQQRLLPQTIQPTVVSGTQEINLNIDISGQQLSLSGTPEEIRNIAKNLAPEIIPIIERAIAHTLNNNNSAEISKATDARIYKF